MSSPEIAELVGPDPLTEALRGKVRDLVATLFDEEVTQVLGAAKGERVATRCGYRHGEKARMLTTGLGLVQLAMPRGRLFTLDGREHEWASHLLRRYQRRARAVDGALFGGVPVRGVKGHPMFPSCGHRKVPTRHLSAGGYALAFVPLRRPALIFSLSR